MKELRTDVRTAFYNSDWDLSSVINRCKEKNISPMKVGLALSRCYKFIEGFDEHRMGGALTLIFNLSDIPKG